MAKLSGFPVLDKQTIDPVSFQLSSILCNSTLFTAQSFSNLLSRIPPFSKQNQLNTIFIVDARQRLHFSQNMDERTMSKMTRVAYECLQVPSDSYTKAVTSLVGNYHSLEYKNDRNCVRLGKAFRFQLTTVWTLYTYNSLHNNTWGYITTWRMHKNCLKPQKIMNELVIQAFWPPL